MDISKEAVAKLKLTDLQMLKSIVDAQIEVTRKKEQDDFLDFIRKAAEERGVAVPEFRDPDEEDIKQTRAKPKPKFKNPDDHSQQWSGRGKPPAWVFAYEADPMNDRNDLLIDINDRPAKYVEKAERLRIAELDKAKDI